MAELFICQQMLTLCARARVWICINHGGTNRNRCTQRLVILHAQVDKTLIAHQKLTQCGLYIASQKRPPNKGRE